MIHYRIRKEYGLWLIEVRGLLLWHEFNGERYDTSSEALKDLDSATNSVACIIKILEA